MEELQLKYIEIMFDKQMPQNMGTEINIYGKIDDREGNLEYKFIVGKGGVWNTVQEFSEKNKCLWKPEIEGEYMVMIQAREKDGKKPLDYLAKEEYSIISEDADKTTLDVQGEEVVNGEDTSIDLKNINDNKEPHSEKKLNMLLKKQELKQAANDSIDTDVFLQIKELSKDEKETLIGNNDVKDEVAFSEDRGKLDSKKIKSKDIDQKDNEIIKDIIIDKKEYRIGEKCSIEVQTNDEGPYLFRFYIRNKDQWDIIKDYDTVRILKYTINEAGEKEFLIQCKSLQSTEAFEDFKTMKIKTKETRKVEITNFKCLNKTLLVGERLGFVVNTNNNINERGKAEEVLLYKFYKLYKDGRSVCIQDYSTKNEVYYKETDAGNYKILCLVKSIFSNKEYEDRAILVYKVKPYKNITINSFVANFNSPQATETEIRFTSEIEGGNRILYRYKVIGPIKEDTGFNRNDEFVWTPIEAGEYEIILYVKDDSYRDEYETMKKIAFTIERKEKKTVKILDVIVDKEKKIIVGEAVNIMVKADGGPGIRYAFTIKENKKTIQWIDYKKSNWIEFIPKELAEYEIEIMVKDKYSNKAYDANTVICLRSIEYLPGEIDYILLPYKETHLVGEAIEFECIIQNTQDVLVKYETKINGQSIEQTGFSKNKKLRFTPKSAGKYTIEVYAKNVKCKGEYDSKKQINVHVGEAAPVIETKVIANKYDININEELTFEAMSRGGKDVCYEFYLMENNEWKKVQDYSKKCYYSFIPFIPGKYKILVLAKSYYKKVNYEDYDQITFFVKGSEK